MRRKIRSYLTLTPFLYRLLLFVIIPVGIFLLQQFLYIVDFTFSVFLICLLMTSAEIMCDYWVFGGMTTRDGTKIEYLKSSSSGIMFVKDALYVNMARQMLESVVIVILSAVIYQGLQRGDALTPERVWVCITLMLLEYVVVVTLLTIGRFFDGWTVNMELGAIGVLLMLGGVKIIQRFVYFMFVLLMILAVLVSIVSARTVVKKVRESYYDKTA